MTGDQAVNEFGDRWWKQPLREWENKPLPDFVIPGRPNDSGDLPSSGDPVTDRDFAEEAGRIRRRLNDGPPPRNPNGGGGGGGGFEDEFARINLEKYQSDYGQFVVDLLSDQGSVFSLERLGSMAEQCAWVGSLRNSGVFIDLEQSTFVYPYTASWGGRERLPVFVGSRQERDLSMMSFESWYNRHPFGRDIQAHSLQ